MMNQNELKKYISYNPDNGDMKWIKSTSNCIKVGDAVKGKTVKGYKRVQINRVRYKAHDLAWLYVYGEWPVDILDHIDNNTENIAIKNLRKANQMQNCQNRLINKNNTSGIKGVKWHKRDMKWHGNVDFNHKRYFAGSFEDIKDAAMAVLQLRVKLHGEFANHGVN